MVGRMMPSRINPIDHPICLATPECRAASSWAEHVPFAMWLISVLEPRVLVELGTGRGTSYCGLCQAIDFLVLPTRAFAIDTSRKVSDRGVILVHDVAVRSASIGAWRFWEEATARYPSFMFEHAQGLGVLAVGRDLPDEVRALVEMEAAESQPFRALFHQLGRRVSLEMELDAAHAERDAKGEELRGIAASWRAQEDRLKQIAGELAALHQSFAWRLTQGLAGLARRLAPAGTLRQIALRSAIRFGEVLVREGAIATARKVVRRARRLAPDNGCGAEGLRNWQSTGQPVFLLISHQVGGGTERHVRDLAVELRLEGIRPVLVRPASRGSILWEERDEDWEVTWCQPTAPEREPIENLLRRLAPVHAHVHHVMGLPDGLIGLLAELGVPYDWTIHDYYAICPRAHLNRADGVYCGEPEEPTCNSCLARLGDYHGRPVADPISTWRSGFARRLGGARRVFAPTEDVRRRLARYFPTLSVLVRPHFETLPKLGSLAARWRLGETVRVAVLGTIMRGKGSERLLACARDARARRLPLEFRVIGSTDHDAAFKRLGNVRVAGPYREHEAYERLAAERCHLAFLPSLWPETYLYTLSIAMAAGFHVICFDVGAQSERLRAWGWGQALPLEAGPDAINTALLGAARSLASGPVAPPPPPSAIYREFLVAYYDFTAEERDRIRRSALGPAASAVPRPHFLERRVHARLH